MPARHPDAELLWSLQQQNIQALQTARRLATRVCKQLQQLFDSIRSKGPNWAASPIVEFLDKSRGQHELWESLTAIGHLVEPVQTATATPGTCEEICDAKGNRIPTLKNLAESQSAHQAAMTLYVVFGSYFQGKANDCVSWNRYATLRQTKPHSWQLEVTNAILDHSWDAICSELLPVTDFDCSSLIAAMTAESRAAVALCRQLPAGQRADESDDNFVTIQQVGDMAGVTAKAVSNRLSEARSEGKSVPLPAIPANGRSPAKYRYLELRPVLLAKFPRRASCFPEVI